MLFFALKQIFHARRIWTLLIILLIGGGAVSFEVLTPLASSVSKQMEAFTKFATSFIVMSGGSTVSVSYSNPFYSSHYNITKSFPFDENDILKISSMEGVEAVYRVAVTSAFFVPTEAQLQKLRENLGFNLPENETNTIVFDMCLIGLEGFAASVGNLPYTNIEKGRFLQLGDSNSIVISSLVEKDWNFTVNDEIPLIIQNETRVLKVVGVYSSIFHMPMDYEYTTVMELDELFRSFDIEESEGRYNVLLVSVKESSNAQSITNKLREEYPQTQVNYQSSLTKTSIELLSSVANTYDLSRNLLLAVSAVMVVLVRLIDLLRNRRELGLYMAIGWREGDVVRYMLLQSVIIGLMGAVTGILFATAMGGYISEALIPEKLKNVLMTLPSLDPILLFFTILIALAFSAFTFIAGYLYFRRLTPLEVLEEA